MDLSFRGQSEGTGKLSMSGSGNPQTGKCHAGIGGNEKQNSGLITINGGILDINASGAAGIGGGGNYNAGSGYQDAGAMGTVVINRGTVAATGGRYGAGIGGGTKRGGSVTINGGTVTGSSLGGSGIGSGYVCASGYACNVTINGGTVNGTALTPGGGSSIRYGDGIGGDYATVTINGGTVTGTGYNSGNGIIGTNITLDYTDSVSITSSSYSGTVTLAKDFYDTEHNHYFGGVVSDNGTLAGKTLIPAFVFNSDGDWHVATNWNTGTVPTSADNVYVIAAATITDLAEANIINLGDGGSLTIADGGQLIHNNEGATATVKKNIVGHSEGLGGWNFIATPIATGTTPSIANGLIAETAANYDLYYYDEDEHYWRNFKESDHSADPNFSLNNGQGYLYANEANTTLSFTGALQAGSNGSYTVDNLSYTATIGEQANTLAGWNLVGNPFPCNATIDKPCYTISGNAINSEAHEANSFVIPPCTGMMVKATGSDQTVTFTKTTGSASFALRHLQIALNQIVESFETPVRDGEGLSTNLRSLTIDNAIVTFNEGSQLEKFVFNKDNAKLYLPQGDKDYAIAFSEAQGEMPLNFKANENGQYTITVTPEGVEMNYLHLIDNMTGADVDLLQPQSYSFNATMTDYESRFKLVFVSICEDANGDNEAFAFFNNGSFVINNEGKATLQVVDVNGRILKSESINGCANVNVNAVDGVYMLRLINGNSVKVQKVIVQ